MKKILIPLLALALTGCATAALNRWTAENKPLAEQGEIKWSDYYKQLYDRAESLKINNKSSILERANIMIFVSHEYESGRMSKQQFEHFRRLAQVAEQRESESNDASGRQALSAALQTIGNTYKANAEMYQQRANSAATQPIYRAPVQTNCSSFGNQINCTSK